MRRKIYWGLATLIIGLIGTATGLVFQHERAEIAQLERDAAESDYLLPKSDKSPQQTPHHAGMSTSTTKPPPGETHDTGHWDGNIWHRTATPKPKKNWWSEDTNKLRLQIINGDFSGTWDAFARSVIAEHPYSEAALEARLGLAGSTEELRGALKYHPESPRLLSWLADGTRSPEEAVAFAKKALRFLPNSSEDYSLLDLQRTPSVQSHMTLGRAYQQLGDYKAALVHLKTTKSLLKPGIADEWIAGYYEYMSKQIAAIEAGRPIFGPDKKQQPTPASDFPVVPPQSAPPVAPVAVTEQPSSVGVFDFPTAPPEHPGFAPNNLSLVPSDKSVRAVEAAQQARADFAREQQQGFEDFLRWMERIEQAKSPAEFDNFLMREMAKQLQGGEAQFTPDRLIRAFETFNRHGDAEGLTQLQKTDPDIVRAMSRQRHNKQAPPRTVPVHPKKVHKPK